MASQTVRDKAFKKIGGKEQNATEQKINFD